MRNYITLIIAWLAIVAVSCTADPPIYWDLDPGVTHSQRVAFLRMTRRWNEYARQQQYVSEPGDGTHRVLLRRRGTLPLPPLDPPRALSVTGVYYARTHVMFVRDDLDDLTWEMTVGHEQGHALGLSPRIEDHIEPPGLMSDDPHSSIVNGEVTITGPDLVECRRVEACN